MILPCETLQSTTDILNLTSTVIGSSATYQCRDGLSDVHTTQCTSDGVWEPNPNSTLDCSMTDHGVPMQNGVIVAVIILVIVAGITIIVVAVFYWRINKTSEPQHDLVQTCWLFFIIHFIRTCTGERVPTSAAGEYRAQWRAPYRDTLY